MPLTGKVALVTAGSRHLGRAIAETLARRGAGVAVNYRSSRAEAEDLVARLTATSGGHHLAVRADVSRPPEVDEMIETVTDGLGPIQLLVNNAGPFSKTPFTEMGEDEWDLVWDANAKATFLCCRAAAPGMQAAGWGRIVNLSAVSASVRNRSIYGLAKAAIEVMTEQLALELGPEITVNAVAPGQIRESLDEMAGIDPSWAEEVTARTALGRLVTRSEVAELVAALCSPAFDMVTGVTVPIDGGLRLPRF